MGIPLTLMDVLRNSEFKEGLNINFITQMADLFEATANLQSVMLKVKDKF